MTTSENSLYKVGDFVYFDTDPASPYQIRRIEEIIKNPNSINVKVQCFCRRKDIPSNLLQLADKHVRELEEELYEQQWPELTELEKHGILHREVYMSRTSGVDILPVTQIRGKCNVTLLSSIDDFVKDYLNQDSSHFYTLVYDQNQKTVVTDRGDIRVGKEYQAVIPPTLTSKQRKFFNDDRDPSKLETLVFDGEKLSPGCYNHDGNNNQLNGNKILDEDKQNGDVVSPPKNPSPLENDLNRLITVAQSIGLFARALDATASTVQPILQISACLAMRDSTLQWAMNTMHNSNYDLGEAVRSCVTTEGPVLVRDQLESWSPSEAQLFEDGMDRYGKEFTLIRQECLSWKTYASIIEFYYMWKASDRYLAYKRTKAVEKEKKLKQIPLSDPDPILNESCIISQNSIINSTRPCEGCCTLESDQWYPWQPNSMHCRLCSDCWVYWKKYGGLKIPQNQRLELMQQQLKKIPGVNEEKKTALRTSTQLSSVENIRKCNELNKEKEKRKLEQQKNVVDQQPPQSVAKVTTTESLPDYNEAIKEKLASHKIGITNTINFSSNQLSLDNLNAGLQGSAAKKQKMEE